MSFKFRANTMKISQIEPMSLLYRKSFLYNTIAVSFWGQSITSKIDAKVQDCVKEAYYLKVTRPR